MAKHRTHSIDFKRQVVQEYLVGETLHGLARRHELSRIAGTPQSQLDELLPWNWQDNRLHDQAA